MANNRMFLFNPATGQRVMLAKKMGGAWYVGMPETLVANIDAVLNAEMDANRTDDKATWCGSLDWQIAYEHADETNMKLAETTPVELP